MPIKKAEPVKVEPPKKEWKQVGSDSETQFIKWDKPQTEVIGIWLGMGKGKFGAIGTIETEDGKFSFSLPVALEERVKLVNAGTEIKIIYHGETTGKSGTTYKAFGVWESGEGPESSEFPDRGPDDDIGF